MWNVREVIHLEGGKPSQMLSLLSNYQEPFKVKSMYFCHALSNFRPWAFIRILETIYQAEKPIMRHFEGHMEEDVKVTILQRMFREGRIYRQLAEEQWIVKLKTKMPQGCNVKLN